MEQTVKELCREYPAIGKALGRLRRQGVLAYVEQDELISAAVLALVESKPETEGLAVTIARRAMFAVIKKNEVRQRGRECAKPGLVAETHGWVVPDSDQWDALIYKEQHIQPGRRLDVYEALAALPAREYRVVSLYFWGDRTQGAIAEELGVTQMTVSRILESAKKNIAKCLNSEARAITNRGKETLRTVLSGRKEAA